MKINPKQNSSLKLGVRNPRTGKAEAAVESQPGPHREPCPEKANSNNRPTRVSWKEANACPSAVHEWSQEDSM